MHRNFSVNDLNIEMFHGTSIVLSDKNLASSRKNCLRRFSNNKGADQPAQADPRLCYSLFGNYHI